MGEALVRRIERLARLDARPVSQVVVAALDLYARLPVEAHQSLRALEALGGEAALDAAARGVAREIVSVAFELTERRLAAAISAALVAGLDTEADILEAAVRLTSSAPPPPTTPAPAAPDPAAPARVRPRRNSGRVRATRE